MTRKKMSMKVLSVFLALIMILGVCAPAVSAAAHDHDHARELEITYTEEKARDYLNAIINKLLGEDTFFADYTVSKDSYYLAIGDDTGYAADLAGKLGLGKNQYTVADWDSVDAATIAKADLITLSYSEDMISSTVAGVMNGEIEELDWTKIVTERKAKYIQKAIDYVVKAVLAKRLENNISVDVPEEEKVRDAVEAYCYGYIAFAKDYSDMVEMISTANPDATVVLLGNYNAFADLGLEISFGDIVINLDDYLTEGRQDAVNDYVNNFLDTLTELKDGFTDSEDVDAVANDYSEYDSLKEYINTVLKEKPEIKDYIEGNITKEELIKDIVERPGSIGGYIEEIEEESGYTIDVWEETLKEEFKATIEEEVRKENGESCTEQEIQQIVDERLNAEWAEEFGQYEEEVNAAVKLKNTYEENIKAYEEDLYNLISDLIADAKTARGVLVDFKNTFAFEYDLLISLAKTIDPEILKDPDIIGAIGEDRAEKLEELQAKITDKIEKKLIDLGWIEEDTLEVLTLEEIYKNIHKLDKKTQEWFNSFDKATVTKMLGGLVLYSEDITVWTEKGLEQFNSIYDNIADTQITIHAGTVDVAALCSAPSSILSIFYAGSMENFIFVDIADVETGLNKLDVTGKDALKAYFDDPTVVYATKDGNAYIAEQIHDALTVTCIHKDDDKDHKCDFCGMVLSECADANNDHKCDYCGKTISECQPGDWEITRQPTKEQDGEKVRKCIICGAIVETASIPFEGEPDEPTGPSEPTDPSEPVGGDDDEGLPTWAIVLIVIGSVLVVGGIGFAIYWFVIRKKRQGAINTLTKG